jgi:hypothetical protein
VRFLGIPTKKDRRLVMIRFMLFSEKIYEVSLDEWLIIEKWLKDMATIVITEVTLEEVTYGNE